MPTGQDIVTDALLEIGVLNAPGQTPAPAQSEFTFGRLNQLLAEWNNLSQFLYAIDALTFTIAASQQVYTIGPSGADWTAPRPVGEGQGRGILAANYVQANSPNNYLRIGLVNWDQYQKMLLREIESTISFSIYNDAANPNSGLHFYGNPIVGDSVELWVRHQSNGLTSLSSSFEMPSGYQKAVSLTLAENIFGAFQKLPGVALSELTRDNARKARAAIAGTNILTLPVSSDTAGLSSRRRAADTNWWRTGGF